jgi:FMN phosphatase YigB (HAD superfamily)
MTIRAAIFDIGNVLVLFDYMRAARRLMEKNGLTEAPDRALIADAVHRYESGRMDRGLFLDIVRPEFRDSGPAEDFVRIWEDIFEENRPMTSLARRVAGSVPVFLISNIGDIHLEYLRRTYDVFGIFSDGLFSFETGLMKPDPGVFDLARTRFDVDPSATVYFDDVRENCDAAASRGFVVHCYDATRHRAAEDLVNGKIFS